MRFTGEPIRPSATHILRVYRCSLRRWLAPATFPCKKYKHNAATRGRSSSLRFKQCTLAGEYLIICTVSAVTVGIPSWEATAFALLKANPLRACSDISGQRKVTFFCGNLQEFTERSRFHATLFLLISSSSGALHRPLLSGEFLPFLLLEAPASVMAYRSLQLSARKLA